MELQSVCGWRPFTNSRLSTPFSSSSSNPIRWRDNQRVRLGRKHYPQVLSSNSSFLRITTRASSSSGKNFARNAGVGSNRFDRPEPYGGKSGSVSFHGLTHQVIEEGKLVSSPFKDGTGGSLVWVLAPVALISSLVLPQFLLGSAIYSIIRDEILSEIVMSFSSEAMFYSGLAAFLHITDKVQKPYLQFSPKRWGLITGLKGYLTSAYFTMGLKVFAPLLAVFITGPVLGLPALIAVLPFLVGCAAQFAFEVHLDKRGSSSWPLVPIIFEVYRIYQLSKAAHFVQRLMYSMKGPVASPALLERSGAMVAMLVCFQALGVVCLWSLMTFLLRLFPSRPVAEQY